MASKSSKPAVLILGGVGFVGRTLTKKLVDEQLCSHVRVADKRIPMIAYCSDEHTAALEAVECVQTDLCQEAHVTRAFAPPDGVERFDIVINLAAETRYGLDEAVYQERIVDLGAKVGAAAAAAGVRKFIEVSTAQVYKSQSKRAAAESAPLKPWTKHARAKLQAEEALLSLENLPVVVARLATVYGNGDEYGLMPRVVTAAAYQKMGEKMKFLWGPRLKLNTVHVDDAVNAIWHLAGDAGEPGAIFNICDSGNTTQGSVCEMLGRIFGIKVGYHGTMISNMAKLNLSAACEAANEKHLRPWHDLCKEHKVNFTNLTPYLDREVLSDRHLYVDGSAIESTGFTYAHPQLTEEALREQIQYAIAQKTFPAIVGAGAAAASAAGESKS